ncbi:MAG: MotA/TolQ/ExbB proton channel family protein [Candidatus Acidiferrales bacterium]
MLIACATVFVGDFLKLFSWGKTISVLALLLYTSRLETLITQTGWVARVVLCILLVLSVFSWAIILQKSQKLGQIDKQTRKFLEMFRAARGLPDPATLRMGAGASPLVHVYQAGYRELEAQLGMPERRANAPGMASAATAAATIPRVKSANAVGVQMQVAAGEEVRGLEKWMSWLATTGSVSPFIGLFGTVWGVMDAFAGLGDAGAASLRAVAPGIAEALITTAAGLFAAIPAVVAYNLYLGRIRSVAARMDSFAAEFVAKIETIYSA